MPKGKFEGGELGAGQGRDKFRSTVEGKGDEALQDAAPQEVSETREIVSPEEARRILGEGFFFGPEEVEKMFGLGDDPIPPIPFSRKELERAKGLGQRLIFQTDTFYSVQDAGGGGLKLKPYPLTIPNLVSYWNTPGRPQIKIEIKENAKRGLVDSVAQKLGRKKTDAPRRGWRLTNPAPYSWDVDATYFDCVDAVVNYARKKVFEGSVPPEPFEEAFDNFERVKKAPTMGDSILKAHALNRLNIRALICERPSEVVYRFILEKAANVALTPDNHFIWTNDIVKPVSTASFPIATQVGSFGSLILVRHESMRSNDSRGMCFSRGQ